MRDRDFITDTPKESDARRFWCAYTELKEYHAGMWRPVHSEERQIELIALAVSLLRSSEKFAGACKQVSQKWPISCRAEFTSPGSHIAWLGQAACCLLYGVPEDLTRRAWWKLTEKEQDVANQIAREEIGTWQVSYSAQKALSGPTKKNLWGQRIFAFMGD